MFERYVVHLVLLIVIPAGFFIWYNSRVKRKELKARKNRTPVADSFIVGLNKNFNTFEPGFGNNSEIPIECINVFLSYGITKDEKSINHIDRTKYECLFWMTAGDML